MTSRNQKNFEFKLGKQGLLLFVAGMSLLLFAAFVVGVMVGIHIDAYPEKIAQSIPDIIRRQLHNPTNAEKIPVGKDDLKSATPSEEIGATGTLPPGLAPKPASPSPVISDTEEKKALPVPLPTEQEGIAKKLWDSVPPKAAQTLPPAANAPVLKDQATTKSSSESKTAKPAVNMPAAHEIAKPLSKTGSGYLVQTGSFQDQQKAKEFSVKFTPLGYKPQIVMVNLPKKGKWFRVVIGGFSTKDEALKAADLIAEKIKGINCVVHPAHQ